MSYLCSVKCCETKLVPAGRVSLLRRGDFVLIVNLPHTFSASKSPQLPWRIKVFVLQRPKHPHTISPRLQFNRYITYTTVSLLREIPVALTIIGFQVQQENVQWSIFVLETALRA